MNKTAHFPLQKVLNFRQTIEDTCGVTLQQTQSLLHREEQKLGDLENHKNLILNDNPKDLEEEKLLTTTTLIQTIDYIMQLNDKIEAQHNHVKKTSQKVEKNRKEYIQAAKNRKTIEKLKEKYLTEYHKEAGKKERFKESEIATRIVAKQKKITEIA
jgi:flagellar FliJ protein